MHFDCELTARQAKNEKKKTRKLSNDEVLKTLIKDQERSMEIAREEFEIQKLYEFLYKTYYVVSLPIPFKNKIQKLIKGEVDGISKPIPPEDIVDMWKRKKNELDKIYTYNKSKGKVFDRTERISYDLAVLLGKYDSYLEWKERERIKAASTTQVSGMLETSIGKHQQNSEVFENDIADILDDLF